MANRRMFSRDLCKADMFLDMPVSARELYFQLGLDADDDGFVSSPRTIQRSVGATKDDLSTLAAKGYIIPFESGVVVITHWKLNNYLRADRYRETIHKAEKDTLEESESGIYLLKHSGTPLVYQCGTQDSIGKDSIGKDRCITSGKPDSVSQETVSKIVGHLNDKAGTGFKATAKDTKKLIAARLNDGFTEDDFFTVIDKKSAEWVHDKNFAKYLRPQTLFGTKFEGYLNQKAGDRKDGADSKYSRCF